MSKKPEKESASQKETKPKTEQKEAVPENSELKEQKKTAQVENKDSEVIKLQTEITKLKGGKLLLLAEIENKRKDFQRQIEYVYKYSSKKIVSRILNFLVDLEERALKAMRSDLEGNYESNQQAQELVNKFKGHLAGMEIIKDNLRRSLEGEGVKEIEVKLGESPANIRDHELIEEIENDNLPEGTIIEVVEKGYFFHEEVLRPVKVKISKKSKKN